MTGNVCKKMVVLLLNAFQMLIWASPSCPRTSFVPKSSRWCNCVLRAKKPAKKQRKEENESQSWVEAQCGECKDNYAVHGIKRNILDGRVSPAWCYVRTNLLHLVSTAVGILYKLRCARANSGDFFCSWLLSCYAHCNWWQWGYILY